MASSKVGSGEMKRSDHDDMVQGWNGASLRTESRITGYGVDQKEGMSRKNLGDSSGMKMDVMGLRVHGGNNGRRVPVWACIWACNNQSTAG